MLFGGQTESQRLTRSENLSTKLNWVETNRSVDGESKTKQNRTEGNTNSSTNVTWPNLLSTKDEIANLNL